jgi:hypothetical protein
MRRRRPRISVVLPTYNRSTRLRSTIDSVRAQTIDDWELVVVSDGSTDDTDHVVADHGRDDDRVHLVRIEHSGRPGVARNAGLARTTGEHVAYLDHDDRFAPEHLAVLLDLLGAGGGADLVATGCVRVDTAGEEAGRSSDLDLVWHPELQLRAALFEPSRVAHRAGLAGRVGGWPTSVRVLEDWGMWLRLADAGARVATTTERTCALELSDSSRRHGLVPRFALVLGRFRSVSEAEAAKARLGEPEVDARLNGLQHEEGRAWYRALAATGGLVLPASVDPSQVDGLVAALPPTSFAAATHVVPLPRGPVLAEPLLCCDPGHAARVKALLESRFRATLAEVRQVLAHDLLHPTR